MTDLEYSGSELFSDEGVGVAELNSYIKAIMDTNDILDNITVRGEISNFKRHPSGHLYFSLKDESSTIGAVMFRSDAQRLSFQPENGMAVIVRGNVTVYVRDGKYQIYVRAMRPDGKGALYAAFENLRRKLGAEGLFDDEHKISIPPFPERVGVITSSSGAALRDILNISGRRFPSAKIYIYPALVQGDGAPESLIEALLYFERTRSADVIIIGRGGGSAEDLWAFNDERLARTIYAMTIPVISAVGHETDFTICDFVSDLRAPTPSAAAELVFPDSDELRGRIGMQYSAVAARVGNLISHLKDRVRSYAERRSLSSGAGMLDQRRQALDSAYDKLCMTAKRGIDEKRLELSSLAARADAMSPLRVIDRGYCIAESGGRTVSHIDDVTQGAEMTITVSDGKIYGRVTDKKKTAVARHADGNRKAGL